MRELVWSCLVLFDQRLLVGKSSCGILRVGIDGRGVGGWMGRVVGKGWKASIIELTENSFMLL